MEARRWRYRLDEPAPLPPSRRYLPRVEIRRLLRSGQLPPDVQEAAAALAGGEPVNPEARAAVAEALAAWARSRRPDREAVARVLDADPFRWRVLEAVVLAGLATADQVAHLAYGLAGVPPTGHLVAGRWLHRLFQWGLIRPFTVSRQGATPPQGGGSGRLLYTPEAPGARLVAARLGQPLQALWRPGQAHTAPRATGHRLAVTDFYVAVRIWLARASGELAAWQPEPRWRFGDVTLAPDAWLEAVVGGQHHRLFVEVDRGTESPEVVAQRMATYNQAAATEPWVQRFGSQKPAWPIVLLVVAATRQKLGERAQDPSSRALALKEAVERLDQGRWGFPRFKFLVAADAYQVPESQPRPSGRGSRLQPVQVRLDQPVCLVLRKPPEERRPVL